MRLKSLWTILVLLGAALVFAADAGKEMLYVEFRLMPGPEWATKSPRKLWVARDKYMRMDEPPDSAGGMHSSAIVHEPDVWMVNWITKTGAHLVDSGPSMMVRPIIFNGLPIKGVDALEFGTEKEFFSSRKAAAIPDIFLDGVQCSGRQVVIEPVTLQLYLKKSTGLPARIYMINKQDTFAVHYGKYINGLPLDPSLFRPPDSIQFQESR